MKNMNLIDAMAVMQKHISTEVGNEEVLEAWDTIRNKVTGMIGTVFTIRQILESDHGTDGVEEALGTHEKHDC